VPKVELHVHLNDAITEATASVLARRHGADPATALRLVDGQYPRSYSGLESFLGTYLATNQFVRTPDDLELVAAEFARSQAAQNVSCSEALFTAMIYVRNGMEPAAMWAALRQGLEAAGPTTRVALVVDAIRDFGRSEAEAPLRLVESADAPIVGLGLTGIEGTVPVEEFVEFRQETRRLGLGFTVHAGEMGPPASISRRSTYIRSPRSGGQA
jgi:adenosine deaminase